MNSVKSIVSNLFQRLDNVFKEHQGLRNYVAKDDFWKTLDMIAQNPCIYQGILALHKIQNDYHQSLDNLLSQKIANLIPVGSKVLVIDKNREGTLTRYEWEANLYFHSFLSYDSPLLILDYLFNNGNEIIKEVGLRGESICCTVYHSVYGEFCESFNNIKEV